jgi:hypothetical protein
VIKNKMSRNSEISQLDMQLFMRTMQNMCEQYMENLKQTTKEIKEHCADLGESLRAVQESMEQSVEKVSNQIETTRQEIRELKIGEKKETEPTEDAEGQMQTRGNHPMETSTVVPEEIPEQPQVAEIQETEETPVTEVRETKETRAMEISGRHGEPEAQNEQDVGERKMVKTKLKSGSRQTNQTKLKEKQRRKKSLAAAGACKKKKFTVLKKKWESRRKTTHSKSSKEAFQAWIDHVRKKHHEQQTTEMQRYVPWDPGGVVYKIHLKFSSIEARVTHRSQYESFPTTKDPSARG